LEKSKRKLATVGSAASAETSEAHHLMHQKWRED
jgi:hypothetical protein